MQEFESISASSYDPSALATKLTAKAAEGWSVVAIVPTGGDVTAFLTRGKEGSDESATPSATPDVKDENDGAETAAFVLAANNEPAADEAAAEPQVEEKVEPVSEPSGWAIAPEATTTTPEPTGVQPTLAATGAAAYQPAAEAAGATTPAAAAATTAAAAAAHTPDPAPAPAVPAGWYADPAGRFELRYWDGSTWTEHVSRAGQQFTDPPVA
jgi:Protein of unknown function (DUF2510)